MKSIAGVLWLGACRRMILVGDFERMNGVGAVFMAGAHPMQSKSCSGFGLYGRPALTNRVISSCVMAGKKSRTFSGRFEEAVGGLLSVVIFS